MGVARRERNVWAQNIDRWMRKIEREANPSARFWPIARHIIFRSRRLLGFLIVRAMRDKK